MYQLRSGGGILLVIEWWRRRFKSSNFQFCLTLRPAHDPLRFMELRLKSVKSLVTFHGTSSVDPAPARAHRPLPSTKWSSFGAKSFTIPTCSNAAASSNAASPTHRDAVNRWFAFKNDELYDIHLPFKLKQIFLHQHLFDRALFSS